MLLHQRPVGEISPPLKHHRAAATVYNGSGKSPGLLKKQQQQHQQQQHHQQQQQHMQQQQFQQQQIYQPHVQPLHQFQSPTVGEIQNIMIINCCNNLK